MHGASVGITATTIAISTGAYCTWERTGETSIVRPAPFIAYSRLALLRQGAVSKSLTVCAMVERGRLNVEC